MKKYIQILLIIFFASSQIFAQFGKNRVHYKDYDWVFIQTTHFDIYFSKKSKTITEFTAQAAEDALSKIMKDLDYEINNRISIIVYDSHNDFQETNTTDSYLSQGIGGFTEPFKNRVVIPFEGDYKKFRHVIHHELVHAVMQDMLYGGSIQNRISKNITFQLPLWFNEGLAEFLSSGWETNTDMFIRDAIINDYLPDIQNLHGYFGYRGGQALFKYISDTYGREKIGELLHKTKGLGNLKAGIKAAIGLSIEALNTKWKRAIKKEYWPEVGTKSDPDEFAKRLTDNKKTGGFYNTSPAISPQGDKIAFISDRDIFLNLFIMDAMTGKIIKKISNFSRQYDLEELNLLFPSVTWSPDNEHLAISKKGPGEDIIEIVDVNTEDYYELPFKLEGIQSTSWSPDGKKLAFSASSNKQSDIYIWNFNSKQLSHLTNDIFSDFGPSWSLDSKRVYFTSDRGKYYNNVKPGKNFEMFKHNFRLRDIYSITADSVRTITRLTKWENSAQQYPIESTDGKSIIFVSDYSGIENLYRKRIVLTDKDTVTSVTDLPAFPLTNSLNGISQISSNYDRTRLVFTTLFKPGYNIFIMNNPFLIQPVAKKLPFTDYMAGLLKYGKSEVLFANYDSTTAYTNPDSTYIIETDSISASGINNSAFSKKDTINSGMQIFSGQYVDESDSSKANTDYSHFVFGSETGGTTDTSEAALKKEKLFNQKLDKNGNYLVNKYKVDFSPDMIYANAEISTYYGLQGTTVLSFSDMLGNHRLFGVTGFQIDLKNSDYGLSYYYLPKRITYGAELFHTARFVYLPGADQSELYRYTNVSGIVSASYPLNTYYRFQSSFTVMNVTGDNLDNPSIPSKNSVFVVPMLSFIHDNTLFGYTSPIQGTRYNFTFFGNPGISNSKQSFYSFTWDYRKYFRFFYDNSFVFRFSGGYSGGANPQRFFLGGTDNWINRIFATGFIPISDPADFAFLSPALPLRGYRYSEQIGTKYTLLNLELRLPVIRYLLTGPLPLLFQNILGTAFLDAGMAWDKDRDLRVFRRTSDGALTTDRLLIGMGFGIRTYFMFPWKFDWAWQYNLEGFSKPIFYLSMGLDF